MTPTLESRYRGCLLGAALGDPDGATHQLMLFTAEGLLRTHNRALAIDAAVDVVPMVHRAWLRWLETRREPAPPPRADGWLASRRELYRRREASPTTLQALRTGLIGHPDRPINNSREASVVAQVLPAALGDWEPFTLGRDLAAITHGHPDAWLAGGTIAHLLQGIVLGASLIDAAEATWGELEARPGTDELLAALDAALDAGDLGDPTFETAAGLGDPTTASGALAIGLYAASATDVLEEGVRIAAIASPAAAAVAGALLGARGVAVPSGLRQSLSVDALVVAIAGDLWAHFAAGRFEPAEEDWNRYPG